MDMEGRRHDDGQQRELLQVLRVAREGAVVAAAEVLDVNAIDVAPERGCLRLTLPLPPSVNHSHRNYVTKSGRRMRVPTKRAGDWTAQARDIAYDAMRSIGWTCPQGKKVIVEYVIYWPDRRRRDPSNLEKLLLDCGEGIFYDDDRWALPRCMDFGYDKAAPRLEVAVRRA